MKKDAWFPITALLVVGWLAAGCVSVPDPTGSTLVKSGYAPVNGLNLYYEIHSSGEIRSPGVPLLLLHGAYSAIGSSFGKVIPFLASGRQLIAVDLQGHGRTADIDRPITYEAMADDAAAVLRYLKIAKADLFGYSMGGGVALQVGLRHPALVRKLVLASASYTTSGVYSDLWEMIPLITPEMFEGTPFKREYDSLAPRPQDWPVLVGKLKTLDQIQFDWGAGAVRSLKAPTLLIVGDADIVKPEHAVEMLRLLGGGVNGDMAGLPASQLAVFPGTTHIGVSERTAWLASMIPAFLDAPAAPGP